MATKGEICAKGVSAFVTGDEGNVEGLPREHMLLNGVQLSGSSRSVAAGRRSDLASYSVPRERSFCAHSACSILANVAVFSKGAVVSNSLDEKIAISRRLLGNPYAYLDDNGNYSALQVSSPAVFAAPDEITTSRLKLQNQYAHLDEFGRLSAVVATPANERPAASTDIFGRYEALRARRRGGRYQRNEIERRAIEMQRLIWKHRQQIWPTVEHHDPVDFLDPSVAFPLIGIDFERVDGLGQHFVDGRQVEVAGVIDNSKMQVRVSRRFPTEIQRFTAAHELGHAVLHEASGLHRDRPLDGSSLTKDPIETEANKFASSFLMPEKLVRQRFARSFGAPPFVLTESTTFALSRGGLDLTKCSNLRALTRILAGATNFGGSRFPSLAEQFRVSEEAMAIRLEELELASY